MTSIRIFYANQLYAECNLDGWRLFRTQCGPKIYNGAYALNNLEWYRMDGTPVLPVDVPKELLTLLLLLS